jgi:hypothetical protein
LLVVEIKGLEVNGLLELEEVEVVNGLLVVGANTLLVVEVKGFLEVNGLLELVVVVVEVGLWEDENGLILVSCDCLH